MNALDFHEHTRQEPAMITGLTTRARNFLLAHKTAYEELGQHEKAAEIDRDMAAMQRLGEAHNLMLRHQSEPAPLRARAGERRCQHCQTEYQPRRESQKYCSMRCANAGHWAKAKAAGYVRKEYRDKALPPKACARCGSEFERDRRDQIYCSESCKGAAAYQRAKGRR